MMRLRVNTRVAGGMGVALLAVTLGFAAVHPRTAFADGVEYVQPSGTKNGYPLYTIEDDGRHMAPLTTASTGAITIVQDRVRYYGYFKLPSNPGAGRLPLVVTLHGIQQTGAESYMKMQAGVEQRRYATLDVDGYSGTWNAGRCCGAATERGYDSEAAILRLISEFRYAHNYNQGRLYLAGFSNGGMMAYRMACDRPDMFAAIAVVAGAYVTPCRPSGAMPVLHIHGTADTTVPYGGTSYSTKLKTRLPSAQESTNVWRGVNDPAKVATTLVTVRGMSHTWPTPSNSGYDGTRRVLEFLLKRHK